MKPPYHETKVPDCGYCKDLGEACVRLSRLAAAQRVVEAAERLSALWPSKLRPFGSSAFTDELFVLDIEVAAYRKTEAK